MNTENLHLYFKEGLKFAVCRFPTGNQSVYHYIIPEGMSVNPGDVAIVPNRLFSVNAGEAPWTDAKSETGEVVIMDTVMSAGDMVLVDVVGIASADEVLDDANKGFKYKELVGVVDRSAYIARAKKELERNKQIEALQRRAAVQAKIEALLGGLGAEEREQMLALLKG